MRITSKNIVKQELIGLPVKIVRHSNRQLENIEGIVLWETKNMLWIKRQDDRVVKVFKSSGVFMFRLPDNTWVKVTGELINHRPEDRVKEAFRRG
ncbi:MAG: ribonuclease P protein subunit [Desulfurococcales archaeon]|nr:ribonuclease P protein subunit [Desulfurococcales archaeon]